MRPPSHPPPGHPQQGFPQQGYPYPPAGPKPSSTGIVLAAVAVMSGGFLFLYLGFQGGRAAQEAVMGLLAVTLICAVIACIAAIGDIRNKRVGRGAGTVAVALLGVLLAVGTVVLDHQHRQRMRERYPSASVDQREPPAPSTHAGPSDSAEHDRPSAWQSTPTT